MPLPKFPLPFPPSPMDPLREIIREGRERIEKVGSDIRSLADELHSGLPSTTSRSTIIQDGKEGAETPARGHESQDTGLLPATTMTHHQSLSEENPVATACVACAVGHFSTSSGLLKEALRFKGEGMTSNEILDRIAAVLEEQNALERKDLSPEKIQRLPEWEKAIAEEALDQSRQLRHGLESIQSVDELEQAAVDTKKYYIKLNRQWYRGRFSHLGAKKAETIAQRVGGK